MKVSGDSARQAFVAGKALAGVAVAVAAHTCELVVMQEGPRRTVTVTGHAAQQGVRIQNQASFALGALVRVRTGAAHTRLVALCTSSVSFLANMLP